MSTKKSDTAIVSGTTENLPTESAVKLTAGRCVKPGGKFIITNTEKNNKTGLEEYIEGETVFTRISLNKVQPSLKDFHGLWVKVID